MPRGIYNHRQTKTPIYTKESRRKIGNANKGKKYVLGKHWKLSEKNKENIRKGHLGKKYKSMSEIGRKNISEAKKGKLSPRKGKKYPQYSGEKSWSWKGGITPINHRVRNSFEFKQWRSKVFERDNWTCQTCGIRGIYLECHHIKSFAKYSELRFEISNGVTLCRECHKLTDNYKGNNKEKLL